MGGRLRLGAAASAFVVVVIVVVALIAGLHAAGADDQAPPGAAVHPASSPAPRMGSGVCPSRSAHCAPAGSPDGSGPALSEVAAFIVGFVFLCSTPLRRFCRPRVSARLPTGVHRGILRPPRWSFFAL
ncbi:MAG TPA: hypothetical protein VMV06_08530 [Acidimicrobiales bacterium]|nr:hypothetical protein [Acidimicrobiales bacterium]HVB93987.1 hypothetical protein [Acidimicrobiales bacterium]